VLRWARVTIDCDGCEALDDLQTRLREDLAAARMVEDADRGIVARVILEGATPLTEDGSRAVDVDAMSEGTADQLFLALRLAAAEQSVANGSRLPFLADDLFINFDDARARAGFEVLAELAASMQILFFTHHAHLADLAKEVVGANVHSRCDL
jgi:recombinational DNA repair ATPase RecF